MNPNWKLCPLLIVVLALCVHEGLSIKCWVCRSNIDPACDDPFDNSTLPLTDCSYERSPAQLPGVKATMCRKMRQRVNAEWRIIRSCAYLGEPGVDGNEMRCQQPISTEKIFVEYCTCNSTDGCNT